MKRIGLVGGTTWHSTAVYYQLLNEGVQERLGGVASADLVLASVNFAEVAKNNLTLDWDANLKIITEAACGVAAGGSKALLLCANTMHMHAPEVADATGLPVIHIAEATATACLAKGITTVALLGTRFTMEMDFFRDRLSAAGLKWVIPSEADRAFIHETIFAEMAKGLFTDETRARYVQIIQNLPAEGVILGCTELPILIRPDDVTLPTFDTTAIHVAAALEFMLA
jgi:aspartate racemase